MQRQLCLSFHASSSRHPIPPPLRWPHSPPSASPSSHAPSVPHSSDLHHGRANGGPNLLWQRSLQRRQLARSRSGGGWRAPGTDKRYLRQSLRWRPSRDIRDCECARLPEFWYNIHCNWLQQLDASWRPDRRHVCFWNFWNLHSSHHDGIYRGTWLFLQGE
jgi:hypothetical protein